MKNLKLSLKLFLAILTALDQANAGSKDPKFNSVNVVTELTSHQWTIAEYSETIKDTSRNMTLLMLPCEKDNLLKFVNDTSYVIMEGSSKCSASDLDIKGQGTWEYSENEKVITDSYSGGMGVKKTILDLNDGLLKVQYKIEGRTITITYLSETGVKDESKKDQYVDNSDPCSNITEMIREIISKEKKWTLIGLGDFNKMDAPSQTVESSKKIVLAPVSYIPKPTESYNADKRNNDLMQQGKKSGMDYIVTGMLLRASAPLGSDGKPYGNVKYTVYLLDVKKGKIIPGDFEYPVPGEPDKPKKSLDLGKIAGIAGKTALGVLLLGNKSTRLLGVYALCLATSGGGTSTNTQNSSVFSSANDADRKKHFDSSLSLLDAIDKTENDVKKFLKKEVD